MIGQISASNQLRTSFELAPNMFGVSSELASVMEFGYNRAFLILTASSVENLEMLENNYSPHPLTPTSCLRNNIQLITGISPCCGCL